jgi:hypothetical protein
MFKYACLFTIIYQFWRGRKAKHCHCNENTTSNVTLATGDCKLFSAHKKVNQTNTNQPTVIISYLLILIYHSFGVISCNYFFSKINDHWPLKKRIRVLPIYGKWELKKNWMKILKLFKNLVCQAFKIWIQPRTLTRPTFNHIGS